MADTRRQASGHPRCAAPSSSGGEDEAQGLAGGFPQVRAAAPLEVRARAANLGMYLIDAHGGGGAK